MSTSKKPAKNMDDLQAQLQNLITQGRKDGMIRAADLNALLEKKAPVAFLVVKEGSVRMIPMAEPANTTVDRVVEMIPDTLDKLTAYLDSKKAAK